MKRGIAFLLVMVLCFSLCSCTGKVPGNDTTGTTAEYVLPTPVVSSDISLPYTSADKLDPYASAGMLNRTLLPVLFEGLFTETADGRGRPVLASSGKIEPAVVTVKLRQNACFSDGTEVLAGDVRTSFSLARASKWYAQGLAGITGVTAIDNYTLRFTLSHPDPYVLNVLTFPIVKENAGAYLGTGKYAIKYLEKQPYLTANTFHSDYNKKWNKEIALYDMAKVSGAVYPFKANKISVYYDDLSDGAYTKLSSYTVSVPTHFFVYAGINQKWSGSLLSSDWMRRVVNIGIDRSRIAASSFLGQTEATAAPFPKSFYQLEGQETAELSGEAERAVRLLEEHGYTKENADGVRTNGAVSLSVSILVCADNAYKVSCAEALGKSMETLGFSVNIRKENQEDFLKALSDGYYDLYIGEVQLPANSELSAFFESDGAANAGIGEDAKKYYSRYLSGTDTTKVFLKNFYTDVPFLPLFYRKAVFSLNPNLKGCTQNEGQLLSSVYEWKLQ